MDLQFSTWNILLIGAWFIQMGAHEGAHAYVAHYCGDDTAHLMGKRSFNPLAHVDPNVNSILLSVICPIVTALMGWIPIGMAWVPVNPQRLKRWNRDMAVISFAGPAANFVVVAMCLVLHLGLSFVAPGLDPGVMSLERVWWMLDQFCLAVCLTSALYGFFNLVPMPPLDGSKILRYFLSPAARETLDSWAPYGFWVLVLLFQIDFFRNILFFPLALIGALW